MTIAKARRLIDRKVAIVGIVTAPATLLDGSRRLIVVQDATGAIEVRLPDTNAPAVGTRLRVEGKVGRAYGAPRIAADAVKRLGSAAVPAPLMLYGSPKETHEWRLVTVRGRIDSVRKLGDRWRAELVVGGEPGRGHRPVRGGHPGRVGPDRPPRDRDRHRPSPVPVRHGPPVRDPAAGPGRRARRSGQFDGEWRRDDDGERRHRFRHVRCRFAGRKLLREQRDRRPGRQPGRPADARRSDRARRRSRDGAADRRVHARRRHGDRSGRAPGRRGRPAPAHRAGRRDQRRRPDRVHGPGLDRGRHRPGRRAAGRRHRRRRPDERHGRRRPSRVATVVERRDPVGRTRPIRGPGRRTRRPRDPGRADGGVAGRDPPPATASAAPADGPDGRPTGRRSSAERRPFAAPIRTPRGPLPTAPPGHAWPSTIHARRTRLDARESAGLSSPEFRACGTAN